MALGRYVVDAVVLEGRSPTELARSHNISRSWIYELVARYRAGGYDALEPRSRRPHSCAHQTAPAVARAILALRARLIAAGHDAGPQTIAHHLRRRRTVVPSLATIWRVLRRAGVITPQPHKRPRSSFLRFEAALPNELWQADITHWPLASGTEVEIMNLIDDHSRLALAAVALPTTKAADVVEIFASAAARYGLPASVLSDNAAVFSGKSRGGRVLWESECTRLGVRVVHSTPYHPQTCGKVERFHQTQKRYLARQMPARTVAQLQAQLDAFRRAYNQRRPHRALGGRTPLVAWNARIKARPETRTAPTHFRVRHDTVDHWGKVSLRYQNALRHIQVGRAYQGAKVRLLIAGMQLRVVREDGTLLRELTLDPDRLYFGNGRRVHNDVRQASGMT